MVFLRPPFLVFMLVGSVALGSLVGAILDVSEDDLMFIVFFITPLLILCVMFATMYWWGRKAKGDWASRNTPPGAFIALCMVSIPVSRGVLGVLILLPAYFVASITPFERGLIQDLGGWNDLIFLFAFILAGSTAIPKAGRTARRAWALPASLTGRISYQDLEFETALLNALQHPDEDVKVFACEAFARSKTKFPSVESSLRSVALGPMSPDLKAAVDRALASVGAPQKT